MRREQLAYYAMEAAASALVLLNGCRPSPIHETLKSPPPNWILVKDSDIEKLGGQRMQQAVNAAIDWDRLYGCGRTIRIEAGESQNMVLGPISGPDLGGTKPGAIQIATKVGDPYFSTLAMMTSACEIDNATVLNKPLEILQGRIVAYHGLRLEVKTNKGDTADFTLFHDGMAERNASAIQGYTSPNDVFEQLRILTLRYVPLTNTNAIDWVKNNDVPSFVRTVLSLLDSEEVTSEHMNAAINLYINNASAGARG